MESQARRHDIALKLGLTPALRFPPQRRPRDPVDLLVALVVGSVLTAPFLAAGVLASQRIGPLGGISVFFLSVHILGRAMVRSLEVDEYGIRFVRQWGGPKRIPWSELEAMDEAPRGELIAKGWLWPPAPFAREMSSSSTSRGHLRFRWRGKVVYFAPQDLEAFREAVAVHWPREPRRSGALRDGVGRS